jgi:hypothetical protein
MAKTQTFARDIKVATAGLEPEAISALLATAAREALAEAQAAGEFPRSYITSVNGQIGAPVESVKPPGPIVFTGNWWTEILTYGVSFAAERSPVKSGRYKSSWFAMADGSAVSDYEAIPLTAECIITNDQPYSRRIEVGRQKVNVPPGIVEDLVSALRRRYGDMISARRQFINLEGAYRLVRKSRRRGRGEHVVTYPAAILTMRL